MSTTNNLDASKSGTPAAEDGVTSPSPRRRRLIKGATALAPAVFTLHSGTARAMNSAAAQCLNQTQGALDTLSREPRLHLGRNASSREDPRFVRQYNMEGIVAENPATGQKVRLLEYPSGFFNPGGKRFIEFSPGKYHPEDERNEIYVDVRTQVERHELACFDTFAIDDQGAPMPIRPDPYGTNNCPAGTTPLVNSCWSSMS